MSHPISRTLQLGDEADLEAFLSGHLESSMFLLGNARAAGLSDRAEPLQGTYVAAFEGGVITAVAAYFWNGNLIVQAPRHAAYLACQAVRASGRPLRGVLGPSEQVEEVKTTLNLNPSILQLDEVEKLYSLDLDALSVPDLLASGRGRARHAEPRDADLLTGWRVAYSVETLNETELPDLQRRCRSSTERYIREQRLWVLEAAGTPVACSAFNAATEEAVQVGSVWTPPEHRNQGYGRAVVAASLLDARTCGATKGVLFTGSGNLPARIAYEGLGFRSFGDYRMTLLSTPISL